MNLPSSASPAETSGLPEDKAGSAAALSRCCPCDVPCCGARPGVKSEGGQVLLQPNVSRQMWDSVMSPAVWPSFGAQRGGQQPLGEACLRCSSRSVPTAASPAEVWCPNTPGTSLRSGPTHLLLPIVTQVLPSPSIR